MCLYKAKPRHFWILIFISILCFSTLCGQKKVTSWYLVDSFDYYGLSHQDKIVLDSFLTLYHKSSADTERLGLINTLIENLENEKVWPMYNNLLYTKAEEGGNSTVHLKYKAGAINNFGYEKLILGDFQAAIGFYSQALALREKIKDHAGIANSLNNLAYVFDDLRDTVKAEEYYLQALKIREKLDDYQGLIISLNNLASFYSYRENLKLSLSYNEKALTLARKYNYKKGIAHALNNLGDLYRSQGDFEKAMQCQKEALPLRIELGDKLGLSSTYYNFSRIYCDMHDFKNAELYALKAIEIARAAKFPERIRDGSFLLYRIYRQTKQFEKALEMHLQYIKMHDSLNNQSIRQSSLRQQFKYEYEKKETVMKAEQEKKDILALAEKRKQRIILLAVSGVGILMLILALFIYRNYLQKQKAHKEISLQKEIIEQKQKEILDSIHYAKRIQRSLLTSELYIKKNMERLKI